MRKLFILSSILVAFFVAPISSFAGGLSEDQKAVWATINGHWLASKNKDFDKYDSYLADDFSGWSNDDAIPNNKADHMSWTRFSSDQSKTLKYQLNLVKLVVHGDAAIAHYYYVSATENKDGKRKSVTGRWSDTLVRDGKNWKFIGWQGGEDEGND